MGIARRTATVRLHRRNSHSIRIFQPVATIKFAMGRPCTVRRWRGMSLVCLMSIHRSFQWQCMPLPLGDNETAHVPDFLIFNVDGSAISDRRTRQGFFRWTLPWWKWRREKNGTRYRLLSREEIYDGFRLRNAKDLLRYGHHVTPLGDRSFGFLAALDDEGSLPLVECLKAFQETKPVAGIAALILSGFVHVDLDDGPLGPDTLVEANSTVMSAA